MGTYIKEFDSLRALSVLAVMFSHYLGQYKWLSIFGASGVTLFFVLSGYLITHILFQEKEYFQIDATHNLKKIGRVLKTFYIRRSLRIFPIYYITLVVLVLLNIDSARQYWMYHFFYASNFLYSFKVNFDHLSHFWSLAVEEQFYLVWPFLILLLPLRSNNIGVFTFLIVVSVLFKCWMIILYSVNSLSVSFLMPACMESFGFGAIAVSLSNKKLSKRILVVLLLSSLLLFGILQILPVFHLSEFFNVVNKVFDRTVFSFFCATILLMIVKDMHKGIVKYLLNNSYLMLLGKISYGVYIFHMFVPGILIYLQLKFNFSLNGSGVYLLLDFLVSFLMAWISYKYIESPFNRLKRNFVYLK